MYEGKAEVRPPGGVSSIEYPVYLSIPEVNLFVNPGGKGPDQYNRNKNFIIANTDNWFTSIEAMDRVRESVVVVIHNNNNIINNNNNNNNNINNNSNSINNFQL